MFGIRATVSIAFLIASVLGDSTETSDGAHQAPSSAFQQVPTSVQCDQAFMVLPVNGISPVQGLFSGKWAACKSYQQDDFICRETSCIRQTLKTTDAYSTCKNCNLLLPESNQTHIKLDPTHVPIVECAANWLIPTIFDEHVPEGKAICTDSAQVTFLCKGECFGSITCKECYRHEKHTGEHLQKIKLQ